MKIVLHIERLVLEGLTSGAALHRDLPEVVQAELMRLLTGAPVAPTSTTLREVPAPAARPGGGQVGIGQSIARAVHGALGASR